MNEHILNGEVQQYINMHIDADASKIALAKSPFKKVSSAEIAGQIVAKKKSIHKLPTWVATENIYYPPLLSIEQCSSEPTAFYKANLATSNSLIDLTAGFGVDSYFFSKKVINVSSCEINEELAEISSHNAKILGANNIEVLPYDGISYLATSARTFDTIYIDPARRSQSNKVFKLQDCAPNVIEHLDLLLKQSKRIIIKTAPLLDISAGLSALKYVKEIHIVSVKNECKELLWIMENGFIGEPTIVCSTLNQETKVLSFPLNLVQTNTEIAVTEPTGYLYEPDVALLKSGAFNFIAEEFGLAKLHHQTHLYFSKEIKPRFLGRIFEIKEVMSLNLLKKDKNLIGNVVVRNFPERAENLVSKYKIKPDHDEFIIFTKNIQGFFAIKAAILQHY